MIGDWDFSSQLSDVKIYDAVEKTWDGPKVRLREGQTWEQFRWAYWIDKGRKAITSIFRGDNTCYETETWTKLFVVQDAMSIQNMKAIVLKNSRIMFWTERSVGVHCLTHCSNNFKEKLSKAMRNLEIILI